jgi:signal transduction histidine kinase
MQSASHSGVCDSNSMLPVLAHSVLIVDDEPENLTVMRALLEDQWEIHTASSGHEALGLLSRGIRVDLVIADQRMAGMTGVELLAHIAQHTPEIMRIVLTAYCDVEPMLEAVNRGSVFAFVVKPCEPEQLRATVAEALRMKDRTTLVHHLIEEYTERRQVLDKTLCELKAAQEQVLAAERMTTVGRVAAGIVHNLRNLSFIMCVLVEEIQLRTDHEPLLHCVQSSRESLQSLVKLLECIRQFACVGDGLLSPVPTEMQKFLQQTVDLAVMQSRAAGVRCPVQVEVGSDVPLLPIDADRMMQALLALIDNAIRASQPGNPIRVVARTVDCTKGDRMMPFSVCIEVADRGCGMDDVMLASAMQPFFSGFSPPGLGLGLETARLVAQAHGGRIELESKPGAGTTAALLIPVERSLPS